MIFRVLGVTARAVGVVPGSRPEFEVQPSLKEPKVILPTESSATQK